MKIFPCFLYREGSRSKSQKPMLDTDTNNIFIRVADPGRVDRIPHHRKQGSEFQI